MSSREGCNELCNSVLVGPFSVPSEADREARRAVILPKGAKGAIAPLPLLVGQKGAKGAMGCNFSALHPCRREGCKGAKGAVPYGDIAPFAPIAPSDPAVKTRGGRR